MFFALVRVRGVALDAASIGTDVCLFPALPVAPAEQGYRNKCEFTLSLAADGLATTGFRAGRYSPGVPMTVESPADCPQVSCGRF